MRWISLIAILVFALFGSALVGATICYQESANVSTSCGGFATGKYSVNEADPWYDDFNMTDGNYSTHSSTIFSDARFYINYTKPIGAIRFNSTWSIKSECFHGNYTLPASCWDYANSSINLFVRARNTGTPATTFYCLNGSNPLVNYHEIKQCSKGGDPNPLIALFVYDEAMYWNLSNYGINVTIRDSSSDALILENVTIEYKTPTSESIAYTTTGNIYRDDLESGTYELTIYANNTGYSRRTYTVTSNRSITQLTAYLSLNTSEVTFTVTDKYSIEYLENVLCSMYQYIGGSFQPIESRYTDITGKVKFTYQDNVRYRYYFSRSDYEDYIFYLNPVLFSEYSVSMTPTLTLNITPDYDGISVIYAPTLFYPSENNFTFLIQSPDGLLKAYGYTLSYPGGSDTQADNNAVGSQLESTITISGASSNDTLMLYYYYDSDASGLREFTFYYPIMVTEYNGTMVGMRDQTYGLGIIERLIIATIAWLFVAGIGTLIGRPIPALGLATILMGIFVYIGFIPIWSVLISIFVVLLLIGSVGE